MAKPGALIPALIPAVALGGAWWWAAARLVLAPEHSGAMERALMAGGWGLSLLPVHVTSRTALAAEAAERALRRRQKTQDRKTARGDGEGRPEHGPTGQGPPAGRTGSF